jgi:periplasmic copper chaperone A
MFARRLPVAAAAAVLLMVPFAGVAFAHVEAESDDAVRGGAGTVTFTVPTEKDVPSTKVEIAFPTDTPLLDVTPQPVDGWTSALTTAPPAAPATGPDGQPVTALVTRITWTATAGGTPPEKSQEFPVEVGRFPDVASVEFKALQTYADGSVVSWIEEQPEGAPEPENPAPVLTLTSGTAPASAPSEAAAPTVTAGPTPEPAAATAPSAPAGDGVTAGVVAVLALGLAGGAVAAARRRANS